MDEAEVLKLSRQILWQGCFEATFESLILSVTSDGMFALLCLRIWKKPRGILALGHFLHFEDFVAPRSQKFGLSTICLTLLFTAGRFVPVLYQTVMVDRFPLRGSFCKATYCSLHWHATIQLLHVLVFHEYAIESLQSPASRTSYGNYVLGWVCQSRSYQ